MVSEINQASQVSTLLSSGTANNNRSSFDLITGADTQLPNQLFSGIPSETTEFLNRNQVSSLDTLSSFVENNVEGPEAARLQESIAAIRQLNSLGEDSSTLLDPIFSLLASNSTALSGLENGSIVDQLL